MRATETVLVGTALGLALWGVYARLRLGLDETISITIYRAVRHDPVIGFMLAFLLGHVFWPLFPPPPPPKPEELLHLVRKAGAGEQRGSPARPAKHSEADYKALEESHLRLFRACWDIPEPKEKQPCE